MGCAGGDESVDAIDPADGASYLPDERIASRLGGGEQAAGDVGGYRDGWVGEGDCGENAGYFLLRGLHECAVEGCADGEHHRPPSALGFGDGGGFFNRGQSAGDDGLRGRIEVCGGDHQGGFRGGLSAGFGHLCGGEREDGGHGALTRGDGQLHGASAGFDGAYGVGKAEGSSGDVGGPLSQRVPGGQRRLDTLFGEYAERGDADGEDGRLGIFGEAQVFFRAFKNQFGERKAKSLIGFGKGGGGDGKVVGEVAAHANGLRTLAWKEKSEAGRHFRENSIVPGRQRWGRRHLRARKL